jgi:hypothetical protein
MSKDFDNHRRIFDRGDDLQGAAAIGAVFHVDIEAKEVIPALQTPFNSQERAQRLG